MAEGQEVEELPVFFPSPGEETGNGSLILQTPYRNYEKGRRFEKAFYSRETDLLR